MDAFGAASAPFLVREVFDCRACREIEPEALAFLVGWKVTLKDLARRMRCSACGKESFRGGCGCTTPTAWSSKESALTKNAARKRRLHPLRVVAVRASARGKCYTNKAEAEERDGWRPGC